MAPAPISLSSPLMRPMSATSAAESSVVSSTPPVHGQHHRRHGHHRRRPAADVTFRFHDERVTSDPIVFEENLLPGASEGDICEVVGLNGEVLDMFTLRFHSPEVKKRLSTSGSPLQMSVLTGSGKLASHRGSRNVRVRVIDRKAAQADLLTFYIKDLYLTRSDMWRIPAELLGKTITEGQQIEFVKTLKLNINTIHKNGHQVKTSCVGPDTKAVFRSQSVRYLIFLQMSTEMWFFDETGESYFHKVINSYLPELFRQWREVDAHHLISIVMFTGVDLSSSASSLPQGVRSRNVRDHYRIVVDRVKVSDWTKIMAKLRREFAIFQRNVLVRKTDDGNTEISGTICPALKGNILEAINVAATQASQEFITDDSQRGNLQIILVSAGSGLFDVEADLLQRTTQNLMAAGLSIDLVCLTRMPLHAVPLFRYRDTYNNIMYCMPHWIDVSFWKPTQSDSRNSSHWVPRCRIYEIQMMGVMENELSAISVEYLPSPDGADMEKYMDEYDEEVMKSPAQTASTTRGRNYEDDGHSGRYLKDDNPLWTPIMNPSNPTEQEKLSAVLHGNWKHIYPRRTENRSVKWKSVISPASLPITTEVFPSPEVFYRDYYCQTYTVSVAASNGERGEYTLPNVMRAMVSFRVGFGYQIVLGELVQEIERLSKLDANPDGISQDIPESCVGTRIYLSIGTMVHRLAATDSKKISVQIFKKHAQNPTLDQDIIYRPLVQTVNDSEFKTRHVRFPGAHSQDHNWNLLDRYMAGEDLASDPSQFYRSRFVLIPTELQSSRSLQFQLRPQELTVDKMNPEEIRLDGLRKLNYMFYRSKYLTAEERRRERERKQNSDIPELKFYTGDLSAFITQLVESAGEDGKYGLRKKDSLIVKASERYDRSVKLTVLAQELQSERGIRLVDRRWHWKLHQHCFVGSELVAWLLDNFKDIDTTDEAVDYGNELMQARLFHHVEHRHSLLDGHYFYQINPEYSTASAQPQPKTSWFSSIRGTSGNAPSALASSVASLAESVVSLTGSATSGATAQTTHASRSVADGLGFAEQSTESNKAVDLGTDSLADSTMSLDSDWSRRSQQFGAPLSPNLRPRIELSKAIKVDVDVQKKSYRREVVTLHYDRLHNTESCYHILLEWLDTTPKFIEDTIAQWSRTCDRSGLKLVEVPVPEACDLPGMDPFSSLVKIRFAVDPPPPVYLQETVDPVLSDKLFYQKQALSKLDYVLDTEAAQILIDAQSEVDIVYSWGKPYFQHSQYVHKTGATLVELVADTGEFVIVRNPLAGTKSGILSNNLAFDPEEVRRETIDFIQNRPEELRDFFQSIRDRWLNRPAVAVPYTSESPTPDSSVMNAADEGIVGDKVTATLSTSPSSRRPPPPPPSDTPGAASYIYYDLRMY
ncbi:hypothetical protein V1525DRAFT_395628 [Lipomyces kononenkoae]|uniref:Uncharacterized protein n=1 Tax=Lipomyces kononenkoae TaxID=34357 RepID=A0ACC3T8Q5_LIPKO